jgi:hypothetical protein
MSQPIIDYAELYDSKYGLHLNAAVITTARRLVAFGMREPPCTAPGARFVISAEWDGVSILEEKWINSVTGKPITQDEIRHELEKFTHNPTASDFIELEQPGGVELWDGSRQLTHVRTTIPNYPAMMEAYGYGEIFHATPIAESQSRDGAYISTCMNKDRTCVEIESNILHLPFFVNGNTYHILPCGPRDKLSFIPWETLFVPPEEF